MNRFNTRLVVLTISAALAAGCTTTPKQHSGIEQLRTEYDMLASQSYVQRHAEKRLNAAEQAVERAERAWEEGADEEVVDHYVYLANRRLDIAGEAAELGRAERQVQNAEAERRQVLLDIREAQARRAQARAEEAQVRAERAESRARELEESLAQLESDMETLQAERTEEGIVLTLRDILFNVNEAELRPEASDTLDRVASFLNRYENRSLEIVGHTDSTGAPVYNQALSERRAESVRQELVERGIAPHRIRTGGEGAADPVATNETPSGRQQNRRVEILIEDPDQPDSLTAR